MGVDKQPNLDEVLEQVIGEQEEAPQEEPQAQAQEQPQEQPAQEQPIAQEEQPIEEPEEETQEQPQEQPVAQETQPQEEAKQEVEEIEEIKPPEEIPQEEQPENPYEALKKEAEFIANETKKIYQQIVGEEYDPLVATPEQRELYERIREEIKRQLDQQKEYARRVQRLQAFEEQLAKTEPRLQEILDYIQNEIPAKMYRELQRAYAEADVDKLAKLFNIIRREYYAKKVVGEGKSAKTAPEPPPLEKPGVEPVQTEPQFDPRSLARIKDLERKAELLPDDLLPL